MYEGVQAQIDSSRQPDTAQADDYGHGLWDCSKICSGKGQVSVAEISAKDQKGLGFRVKGLGLTVQLQNGISPLLFIWCISSLKFENQISKVGGQNPF